MYVSHIVVLFFNLYFYFIHTYNCCCCTRSIFTLTHWKRGSGNRSLLSFLSFGFGLEIIDDDKEEEEWGSGLDYVPNCSNNKTGGIGTIWCILHGLEDPNDVQLPLPAEEMMISLISIVTIVSQLLLVLH